MSDERLVLMTIRLLMTTPIALAAAGLCLACNMSPTSPASLPPAASRGEPVVRTVEIVGPGVVRPGETAGFRLMARLMDGPAAM